MKQKDMTFNEIALDESPGVYRKIVEDDSGTTCEVSLRNLKKMTGNHPKKSQDCDNHRDNNMKRSGLKDQRRDLTTMDSCLSRGSGSNRSSDDSDSTTQSSSPSSSSTTSSRDNFFVSVISRNNLDAIITTCHHQEEEEVDKNCIHGVQRSLAVTELPRQVGLVCMANHHLNHESYLSVKRQSILRHSFSLPNGLEFPTNPSINGDDDQEAGSQKTERKEPEADNETIWSVLKELMLAFLLAGMGNIAASYWLAKVQSWSVFKNIPQLVILVPPLLGLKGNVEMTLASRLSTHANLGDLDTQAGKRKIILGNMALIQCQASTVGFIAPLIALGLSLISEHARILHWKEIILLVASSVITANVANLVLGSLMCGVILMARKWGINPDNIATPIAASLGDVTTMILLANISHFLYVSLDANQWVQNTLLIFLMSLIPIWAYIARKNPFTRSIIVTGWYPVCGAMLIQNAGGLIMERALKTFHRIANLQLLINGVGGNLVAIQSSRMSTHLHKHCVPKELPKTDPMPCTFPGMTFFSPTSAHTKMARILLGVAIPSHLLFLLVTELVNRNYFLTFPFVSIYLTVGIVHVVVLLQLAYNFVHWLWKVGVNPDNSAIPFLTAFADLIGSILMASAFILLYALQDKNAYEVSGSAATPDLTPVHASD